MTLQHFVSLYQTMMDNGDENSANKILELYKKLKKNNYIIGFVGHFSAGKSSMINTLLQEDILPKSPIPTSGNIVEITSGNGFARVYFNDNRTQTYKEPYDMEMIKAYSKDRSIQKIELSTSKDLLPENSIIIDTPGIDAADDADRLMTESSLHLVDQLFYIMDYNHVQSEVNLYFLKQIQGMDIPFTIVINQIDKHDDMEIPFDYFDKNIKHTFTQWGIAPESIYYSSLTNQKAKYNEFNHLNETLFALLTKKNRSTDSIYSSTQQIVQNHKDYLHDKHEKKLQHIDQVNEDETEATDADEIKEKLAKMKNKPKELEKEFRAALDGTLKNAYLMPATLRDKAKLFLESRQKNFKIGLFRSKKKTMDEQTTRLDSFLQPLQKNMGATIQWKLRDKIISLLTEHDLADPELIQFTQHFTITCTSDELISLVKPGATINGDYILHYTNDVSAHIKNKYKAHAHTLWDKINEEIMKKFKEPINAYEQQIAYYEQIHQQKQEQVLIQKQLQEKNDMIDQRLENPEPNKKAWELIEQATMVKDEPIEDVKQYPTITSLETSQSEVENEEKVSDLANPSLDSVLKSINHTIHTITDLPGFQSLINDLKRKKQGLENRELTVALFGAFSAGKSSFANALLGEGLLPASPNPTTAVINRISPVTAQHKHGEVVILLKDEQSLMRDVLSITDHLTPPETDFTGLMSWIKENKVSQNSELNKTYQGYLQALTAGYKDSENVIGESLSISIEQFASYVTDETKACYMESVTLYYDCSLTKLGITLVDTPGADSVNARHTNVAFDYIKYADAILYVTYYNHALSRADRDFLMQLGRVKESFELDKMFFIINAADLADSKSDLQLVMNYVKEQLLGLGIRFPKIFPVSSKLSLENKVMDQPLNQQMLDFESMFYRFIYYDLVSISTQSALWDIKRAYEMLVNIKQTMELDEQEKENYRDQLYQTEQMLYKAIDNAEASIYVDRIMQRIQRQLHYVQERIAIRFHEFFKDSFNPTTISESGKKGIAQLQKSLKRLINYTGYELLQELRAVSLRVESSIRDLSKETYEDFSERSKAIDEKIILPMMEQDELETPACKQAFISLDLEPFNKVWRRYKGTKSFFEHNEKDVIKEEIYKKLKPNIESYIRHNQQIMEKNYNEQWEDLFKASQQQMKATIHHYVEDNLTMLQNTTDTETIQRKIKKLAAITGGN